MSLLGLPNELLLQIAGYLTDSDLLALLLVNRHLKWLLTPTLYDNAVKAPHLDTDLHRNGSVLHWVAERGYETPVQLLLERGFNILLRDRWRALTALHIAAQNGHVGVVRRLMEHKAAAEAANMRAGHPDGLTPLHLAAENGHVDVVKVMLGHGVDSEIPSSNRATALHCAVKMGHEAVVAVLVENGCQINIGAQPRTIFNSTLLHWLAENCCWIVISKHRDPGPIIEILLAHGGDASVEDFRGRSPLHYAAKNGEWAIYRRLTNDGASSIQELKLKRHQAQEAHSRMMRLLVMYGANVNAIDKNGRTALHDAAEDSDEHAVATLLELGADSGMETDTGKTALQLAVVCKSHVGAKRVILMLQKHENCGRERAKEARRTPSPTGSLEELQSHDGRYVLVMGEEGEEQWTRSKLASAGSRPKSGGALDLEATYHSQPQKAPGKRATHKRWLSRVLNLGSKKKLAG